MFRCHNIEQNKNYTFQQRKTNYLRQQSIMDDIIMPIIVQMCLNDPLRYCQIVIKSMIHFKLSFKHLKNIQDIWYFVDDYNINIEYERDEEEIEDVEKKIQEDMRLKISSLEIFLGGNYF
ncbi:unnamed protein product [Paramecium sonneborni]|uniref:Uncharacterized protein n=1 Tax=Paramecium sonneborni TaxID=65129 RepID=A0A8S1RU61_9CILI|nr:unnamed protein product [Paramecium sonneborni]